MDNILFDLDGTIGKTTHYHKNGWELTLNELGLTKRLEEYLPYEKGLKERYDSYKRLQKGFLTDPLEVNKMNLYFSETDLERLSHKLLDLKESFTIKSIIEGIPQDAVSSMAPGLKKTLESLKGMGYKIGVLSSSRRGIISAFLQAAGIREFFNYVYGEEDMTTIEGKLFDKPDRFGGDVIFERIGSYPTLYVGDSLDIDPLFAKNIRAKFIHYTYEDNSELILKKL